MSELTDLMNKWDNFALALKEAERLLTLLIVDNNRLVDEAKKPEAVKSTLLAGCEAGCDFEMMLRRLVTAMAGKDIKTTIGSRNVAKVRKQAEDLLRRKGTKNNFLR